MSDPDPRPAELPRTGRFGARVFAVKYAPPGNTHTMNMTGEGELVVSADTVILRGRRVGAAATEPMTELRHALDLVVEARNERDMVFFMIVGGPDSGDAGASCALMARSAAEGAEIASLLPARAHPDRAVAEQELTGFWRSLHTATPRVAATWMFMSVCAVVFAAMTAAGGIGGILMPGTDTLLSWGANLGVLTAGTEPWRAVTSCFLHVGIIHLAFNMYVLYMIGPLAERLFGSVFFAVVYLCAGVLGCVASMAWDPLRPSAGASGAIFGIFGALIGYMLRHRAAIPATVFRGLRRDCVTFVVYNIVFGFAVRFIDNAAHLGGLAGGLVLGFAAARPLDPALRRGATASRIVQLVLAILVVAAAVQPFIPRDVATMYERLRQNESPQQQQPAPARRPAPR